ncbi:MAG: hypothetical protein ACD_30C00044G0002 [uncultured bacterium]|nr:MAG: hypothetical protein ACD_30C00044G0002 [uncultured bacterium]
MSPESPFEFVSKATLSPDKVMSAASTTYAGTTVKALPVVEPETGVFSNLDSPLSTQTAKFPDPPSVGAPERYSVAAFVTAPVAVIFGSSIAKDATSEEVVAPVIVTAALLSIKAL